MTKKEITDIRRLSQKKHREEQGCFVAEGVKAIREMLQAGLSLRKLYVISQTPNDILPGLLPSELISEQEMQKISFLQTPSGYFAIFELPNRNPHFRIAPKELTLALDCIQDPGNLGTIIRLADWFGISTIVCSESTVDCYNPKVVQATMGAIARVSIVYTNLTDVLTAAREHFIPIYGTFMEGENIYTANLSGEGVLVMGNEGSGISSEIASLITDRITIPSFKKENVESLNVAIATSICCSEFKRRGISAS